MMNSRKKRRNWFSRSTIKQVQKSLPSDTKKAFSTSLSNVYALEVRYSGATKTFHV